jgi:hypothetical protein
MVQKLFKAGCIPEVIYGKVSAERDATRKLGVHSSRTLLVLLGFF